MSGWLLAFALRTVQVLVEASPTLLCGVITAGVLRRMVGPAGTRKLFGASGVAGLLRSWALGMMLPVCALGVLPVCRELRRSGVSGGNILAFALVGPLINPISFLYGLTLGEPKIILCFAAGSLLLAVLGGMIWEWLCPLQAQGDSTLIAAAEAEPLPAPGLRRMVAVGISAAREVIGPLLVYYLIAAVISGLVSAALPAGSLEKTMQRSDPFSPVMMTAIGSLVYMGPLPGMMRIGAMFEHGNSVGAAFVLLVLGIGVNLGVICWAVSTFRWRGGLVWFALVLALTLSVAYAIERPLQTAVQPADHTHAFDDFTNPFHDPWNATLAEGWSRFTQRIDVLELAALPCLLLLSLVALIDGIPAVRTWLEAWLTYQPPEGQLARPKWDIIIPGPVLGALAVVGLLLFSIVSAFIFYPDRKTVLEDMHRIYAEVASPLRIAKQRALTPAERDEAILRLEQWDLLSRKLQVGLLLRTWQADAELGEKAEEFREALEEARDALLAKEDATAGEAMETIKAKYEAIRTHFSPR
jgi:uncharacterized membrane protein YraQ (UPF0718 family)